MRPSESVPVEMKKEAMRNELRISLFVSLLLGQWGVNTVGDSQV